MPWERSRQARDCHISPPFPPQLPVSRQHGSRKLIMNGSLKRLRILMLLPALQARSCESQLPSSILAPSEANRQLLGKSQKTPICIYIVPQGARRADGHRDLCRESNLIRARREKLSAPSWGTSLPPSKMRLIVVAGREAATGWMISSRGN